MSRVIAAWRSVWDGDPAASDIGMLGEHRVAQMRLLLVSAPTLLGLGVLATDPTNAAFRAGVPVNLLCLAAALVFLVRTRRGTRPPWLAYTTCIWDVSLVSLLHVFELGQGLASTAANGRVTFAGYFLALSGTCVRWDRRLPLVAGGLAAAQYAGIAWWSARIWEHTPAADIAAYGQYDAGVQVERVVTLLLFALVCRSIASWALDVRESAVHDALTGLPNRRTFEQRLHDELVAASHLQRPLSVAMLDVDDFKSVNDRHGHAAGDAVLEGIARAIREEVRQGDVVARWGGDEFALVLPETSVDDAASRVEAIRAALARRPFRAPTGVDLQLTVSAGVAGLPTDAAERRQLTALADARLLDAKRRGRNRVVGQVDVASSQRIV